MGLISQALLELGFQLLLLGWVGEWVGGSYTRKRIKLNISWSLELGKNETINHFWHDFQALLLTKHVTCINFWCFILLLIVLKVCSQNIQCELSGLDLVTQSGGWWSIICRTERVEWHINEWWLLSILCGTK